MPRKKTLKFDQRVILDGYAKLLYSPHNFILGLRARAKVIHTSGPFAEVVLEGSGDAVTCHVKQLTRIRRVPKGTSKKPIAYGLVGRFETSKATRTVSYLSQQAAARAKWRREAHDELAEMLKERK